jgi:hypothetical protein
VSDEHPFLQSEVFHVLHCQRPGASFATCASNLSSASRLNRRPFATTAAIFCVFVMSAIGSASRSARIEYESRVEPRTLRHHLARQAGGLGVRELSHGLFLRHTSGHLTAHRAVEEADYVLNALVAGVNRLAGIAMDRVGAGCGPAWTRDIVSAAKSSAHVFIPTILSLESQLELASPVHLLSP